MDVSAEDYNWAIREADTLREMLRLLQQRIREQEQRIAELEAEATTMNLTCNEYDSLKQRIAQLEKLLLEAFDKQSKLESRNEELTVDHEQFHCLNDENDALGIENEELKRRVAELEAQLATFTAAGQIIEQHIESLRETHEPVTATSTDTHGGISFDGTGRLTKEFPHL